MRVIAIIQARLDSIRFPKKVLEKIDNKKLINFLIMRILLSKQVNQIVVAIPNNKKNVELEKVLIKNKKIYLFKGNNNNVLDRYYKAAKKYNADYIVRITADCPFTDPNLIDELVIKVKQGYDYVSNTLNPTFPDGFDVEVFKMKSLELAYRNAKKKYDLEHVTPYLKRNKNIKKFNLKLKENFSDIRVTVDYKNDLIRIKKILIELRKKEKFSYNDILGLFKSKPHIFQNDQGYERNEGGKMNSGQKLWSRAKDLIPGGTMLFSKRPENFLPNHWPVYYSKASKSTIWDLDNKRYTDMSFMGVGTNILGYANKRIDKSVHDAISKGNMTTLNSSEDIDLAERLIELHPWSHMVRYARSGGEANAIAVRIARAASGKDNVAVCGYHGWHDWYLAANIKEKDSLNDFVMQGLPTSGVPKHLSKNIFTFEYNNYSQLEKLVKEKNIGTIKMEVERNIAPKNNFLKRVRDLATKHNIVLIFDECTSGFRKEFGGLHKYYKVEPDIAMFGKALGNGYAITAVLGKKSVMENAQKSFISSTFWTDKIGPTAAIATLEVMREMNSWKIISSKGKYIKKKWLEISKLNDVPIEVFGLDAMPSFRFKKLDNLKLKTFFTQEMLKKKILATSSVYVSTCHTEKIIEKYLQLMNETFFKISKIESVEVLEKNLDGPVCHSDFKRLN
jgi:glutamate-1-semialdehyde 2,1-aminomutase